MLSPYSYSIPRTQPIAQIGRGGMAQVFLATMKGSGVTKLAVLKSIWPELATEPELVGLFLEEARLSARMNHPHVVQVYDVGEEGGRPTITMEYLHGQSLAKVLSRLGGPSTLPLSLRLRIIVDILSGLDYAHRLTDYDGTPLGVVHRDVSPQNVLITYDGHVKLVDFGIADTLTGSLQTRSGALRGKLAYMAPDPLLGLPVDCRTDVFSVGVMLWEMLEGRRLWHGKNEPSIIHHLSSGLPMPALRSDLGLPDGLERICRRALSIDPRDRFPTAAAMESEIERILPAVSDSQARHLGKIVSFAFASERAAREELIDQHLRLDQHLRHRGAGSGSWPQVVLTADERGHNKAHANSNDDSGDSEREDEDEDDDDTITSINLDSCFPKKMAMAPAMRELGPVSFAAAPLSPSPIHRRPFESRIWIAATYLACLIVVAVLMFSWRRNGSIGTPTTSAAPSVTTAQRTEPIVAHDKPFLPSGPILEPVVAVVARPVLATPVVAETIVTEPVIARETSPQVAAVVSEGASQDSLSREPVATRKSRAHRRAEGDSELLASTTSPGGHPRVPPSKTADSVAREAAMGEGERTPGSGRHRLIDTTDPFAQSYADPFAP